MNPPTCEQKYCYVTIIATKYWTLLNAQEMAGYRNYVVPQRGSRGDIQKLMTDNHQVVHFNLQFFTNKND